MIPVVDSLSSNIPILKLFKVLKLNLKSSTAHTMDCNDSDFEAFESNLCQILQVRALGKTALLLQHKCPIFALTHQALNRSAYLALTMLDTNPIMADHLMASLIQTIYRMIMKHRQNGSLKGISTLLLPAGLQRKLMNTQFWQLWWSSIYQLLLFLSTTWKFSATLCLSPKGKC